ncbi:PA3496 family putative envelope integrity protein [Vibrio sp. MA40-2]|uniref:PA3496 family putative envelope integrity protein n=1 Tax=Vibrio sp. MA40-2 TaxID=3391828 RepID=UPI0039A7122D
MSINSIDHDQMANIASNWDFKEEGAKQSKKQLKSAEARRRIEMMREIRESGLTLEEAEELGLLH